MTAGTHVRAKRVAGVLLGSLVVSGSAHAGPEEDPPPTWRFRDPERPVKVMVLAGSIGAWPKQPYAQQLEQMCAHVEVRNLSKTGYGAWALKKRFRQQVLDNPRVDLHDDRHEYWLVFQGGLNSVAMPEQTNRHIRDVFLLAHARGIKVVGLTLTPWGDDRDRRWHGINALSYWRHTKTVVDYVTGRSTPRVALGTHVSRRPDPDAPWDPAELPDVGIDLYDSPLRDRTAPVRDLDAMRAGLQADAKWNKRHLNSSETERAHALDADAMIVAHAPRWFLRPELRSFDHIHPNEQGHRLIAQTMCPALPPSWGCNCPEPPSSDAAGSAAE